MSGMVVVGARRSRTRPRIKYSGVEGGGDRKGLRIGDGGVGAEGGGGVRFKTRRANEEDSTTYQLSTIDTDHSDP